MAAAKDKDAEIVKRLQRHLAEAQEALEKAQKKEMEATAKSHELESDYARQDQELQQATADLRLALRRVEDLQATLEADLKMEK